MDYQSLLHNHGKVSPVVLELLRLTNVVIENHDLENVVSATQQAWLRPPHFERWQIDHALENTRNNTIPLFEKLGMRSEELPSENFHDYVFVLASTFKEMRHRLGLLRRLWLGGLRCKTLVFHASNRPKCPEFEETDEFLLDVANTTLPVRKDWVPPHKMPANENEALHFLFDQADMPEELRNTPLISVVGQMTYDHERNLAIRPTTASVAKFFVQGLSPEAQAVSSTCLAISSSPFIGYQDSVLRACLPQSFTLSTIGSALQPEDDFVGMYLDVLARWLYVEIHIFKGLPL